MPGWDDPRGRREAERERWRRLEGQERYGRGGEERGVDPWPRDRHPSRYDQERAGYGRYEDAGSAGYARRGGDLEDVPRYGDETSTTHGGEPYAYAGQEYGMESPADFGSSAGWGFERGGPRGMFDRDDPGVGQSQAGYGAQARSHPDHDFDPDYLRWRDEQLRAHDRDYAEWRREQHRNYDEQYRQFLSERQRHFGQAFHEWRSQRNAAGGVPDTSGASGTAELGKEPGQAQAASEGGSQDEMRHRDRNDARPH